MKPIHDVALSQVLQHLPRSVEREEKPPYMQTMALFDALRAMGYPCELWNAIMTAPNKTLVVAGIRMRQEILDWNGNDPHNYPRIYPMLEGAETTREGCEDLIPGKRQQATKLLPGIQEQSRIAIENAWLCKHTPQTNDKDGSRRL